MPIYEYYCSHCHKIYQFYTRNLNNNKTPDCPVCNKNKLTKEISKFNFITNCTESDNNDNTMQALVDLAQTSHELELSDNPNKQNIAAEAVLKFMKDSNIKTDNQLENALSRTIINNDINELENELEHNLNDPEYNVLLQEIKKYKHYTTKPQIDDKLYDL